MPVEADGSSPHAVPYSPRRAAHTRTLFPFQPSGPSWSQVANGLWGRLVVVPLASARRALLGRDTRRDRGAAHSPDASSGDKLV